VQTEITVQLHLWTTSFFALHQLICSGLHHDVVQCNLKDKPSITSAQVENATTSTPNVVKQNCQFHRKFQLPSTTAYEQHEILLSKNIFFKLSSSPKNRIVTEKRY